MSGYIVDARALNPATFGETIPLLFGSPRYFGRPIFTSGIVMQNGKPTATMAYTFGKADQTAQRVELLKLWINGTLAIDRTTDGAESALPSLKYRFYDGSEDQPPDAAIAAHVGGIENVPAFRGHIYIVLEDFPYMSFGTGVAKIEALIAQTPPAAYKLLPLDDLSETTREILVDFERNRLVLFKDGRMAAYVYDLDTGQKQGDISFDVPFEVSTTNVVALSERTGYLYATAGGLANSQTLRLFDLRTGLQVGSLGEDSSSTTHDDDENVRMGFPTTLAVATSQNKRDEWVLSARGPILSNFNILRNVNGVLSRHKVSVAGITPANAVGARIIVDPNSAGVEGDVAVFYYSDEGNKLRRYIATDNSGKRPGLVRQWKWNFVLDANNPAYYATYTHIVDVTQGDTLLETFTGETIYQLACGPANDPWLAVLSQAGDGTLTYRRYRTMWASPNKVTERSVGNGLPFWAVGYVAPPTLDELFPQTNTLETIITGIVGGSLTTVGSQKIARDLSLQGSTWFSYVRSDGKLAAVDMSSGQVKVFTQNAVDGQTVVAFDDPDTVYDVFDFSPAFFYDARTTSLIHGYAGDADTPYPGRLFLNRQDDLSITLADLLTAYAVAAGYDETDVEASGIDTITVQASIINEPASFMEVVSQVCALFRVDIVETAGKIKFIRKARDEDFVVDGEWTEDDDLVPVEGGNDAGDSGDMIASVLKERDVSFTLPSVVEVKYIDANANYQIGLATFRRTQFPVRTSQTDSVLQIEVPIVSNVSEMTLYAARALFDIWGGAVTYSMRIPPSNIKHEPSDFIRLTLNDGTVYVFKLEEVTLNADYSSSVEAVGVQELVSFPAPELSTPPDVEAPLYVPKPRTPLVFDNLLLDYTKNVSDALVTAWAMEANGDLFYRVADGATLQTSGSTQTVGVIITAPDAPPAGEVFMTDETNVIVARFPGALAMPNETVGVDDFYAGVNAALIGAIGRWELVFFRDVSIDNSNGEVTFSTLLRGRRGTEPHVGSHIVGDSIVLLPLNWAAVATFALDPADVAKRVSYLGVVDGFDFADPKNVRVSDVVNAGPLKPWAPVNVTATEDSGDLILSWTRRTRLFSTLHDGDGDTPLDEEAEAFEVEIRNGSNVVVRTIEASSTTTTYTAAQISADGLTIGATLNVVVYQISAEVGRGWPGGGIINVE